MPYQPLENSVAVIIPVYNGERFIQRALDSVMRQTLQPAEIFVVDDGSTDRTLEILAAEYTGVTVIPQKNGGPAKARNAAIRAATSHFLAFLDADDWWEPAKLELQVAALRAHPQAVANYTALNVVVEADGSSSVRPAPTARQIWPGLRWSNPIPPACVMALRTAVEGAGGFDERLRGTEDWSLWFKLRRLGPFCACPEPLTDYRQSPGGLSGNGAHMFNDFRQMLEDTLLEGLTGWQRWSWRRRIISFQAFRSAMTARAAGDRAAEVQYTWLSWRSWPSPFWGHHRLKSLLVTLYRR